MRKTPEYQMVSKTSEEYNVWKFLVIVIMSFLLSDAGLLRAQSNPVTDSIEQTDSMLLGNIRWTGQILDSRDSIEPVVFATVMIYRNGRGLYGVYSDFEGRFKLDIRHDSIIAGDSLEIRITSLEYEDYSCMYIVSEKLHQDIYMESKVKIREEIIIEIEKHEH